MERLKEALVELNLGKIFVVFSSLVAIKINLNVCIKINLNVCSEAMWLVLAHILLLLLKRDFLIVNIKKWLVLGMYALKSFNEEINNNLTF